MKRLDPEFWCLEDVIQIIGELPPMTPWQVLNAIHWSGQRRKRCFVGDFPTPKRDAFGGAKLCAITFVQVPTGWVDV